MNVFTDDFKPQPFWWDAASLEQQTTQNLPQSADVVIIGSGYTGLQAALQVARAGKSTLVLDAEALGFGASSRNGGQISTSIKPSFSKLCRKYGTTIATNILREGQASLDYMKNFMVEEDIECEFKTPGRFHAAHTPRAYERLAKECEEVTGIVKTDAYVVTKAEQHSELGTDVYHGGAVYPHHASIHPGLYHKGLLNVVRKAGAEIISHCRVTNIERQKNGFQLSTGLGQVRAGNVIIATNGYTGTLTPWQQRRIIPIGSYIIATEELPKHTIDQLMPTDRILSDTRKLVYYYRPSPDRKRILFGGRVSLSETDPKQTGPLLRDELIRIFPELADVRISHSWSGLVGFTFDSMMHAGNDNGLYYAMGYCGSGVGMASYLGMKIGQQAAGNLPNVTGFSEIPFPTRPLYSGNPWFLAPSVLFYKWRDRLNF
ncbi:FAD-binding oxidoreductase [Lentilitoribacter sp. Alg239-R112]|uniref:NAD(P)/FAD-dependent oxidoreductase n=1 Tax=Lentilitoribacter sp. Alg239-R112 TaxID=2305987 RepID=UPI0013A68A59|nr:FAD-binding oxidoreductase [Lentilitoribacter sp. Alg239-R112]